MRIFPGIHVILICFFQLAHTAKMVVLPNHDHHYQFFMKLFLTLFWQWFYLINKIEDLYAPHGSQNTGRQTPAWMIIY
jgi:hypothetical protein